MSRKSNMYVKSTGESVINFDEADSYECEFLSKNNRTHKPNKNEFL